MVAKNRKRLGVVHVEKPKKGDMKGETKKGRKLLLRHNNLGNSKGKKKKQHQKHWKKKWGGTRKVPIRKKH